MAIKYALFDNHLTSDPNDKMAVVQDQESRTREDVINRMIGRGSTVTKAEALSVLEEFEAAVQEELEDGYSINTPLFKISPSIQGVFNSESDNFTPGEHLLKLNVTPGIRIGEIAPNIKVEKVDASKPKPNIVTCKDVATDTLNETLTPGGVGDLRGSRLKIDPADSNQGVFLIAADGTETRAEVYIRNKPSNLIFMIPAGLAAGEYSLEVRTVFRSTVQLRAGVFDLALQVI
ncbi:DNA-binding domain-containing protein [Reichenbachiella ulvae]|uniref:DUF4469 domain-containing protein n=1 Tax=Reichenbachiella ulvae TaxID=2980104 RepID=A0ABT3CRN5_9BACT|nr:DNA-binding domain-containing protein [Reichenbachiella ulvae]MCV9386365.1 DUF4469 domain-containing protein [Reichenbachiella ulvae]